MSVSMEYEIMLRQAFGFATGQPVERWGDPAEVANADHFRESELAEVKAAVAYSMMIFRAHILGEVAGMTEPEKNELTQVVRNVMAATTLGDVGAQITYYRQRILDRYLVVNGNGMTLRHT